METGKSPHLTSSDCQIDNIFFRDGVAMRNAFETRSSFLVVLIIMLVTIAKCKSNSAGIAVANVSSASKFASFWDDSDDSSASRMWSSSGN